MIKVFLFLSAGFFILCHFMPVLEDFRYWLYYVGDDPLWHKQEVFVGGLAPYRYLIGYQIVLGVVFVFDSCLLSNTRKKLLINYAALLLFVTCALLLGERACVVAAPPCIVLFILRRKALGKRKVKVAYIGLFVIFVACVLNNFYELFEIMNKYRAYNRCRLQFQTIIDDIRIYQNVLVFKNLFENPFGVLFADSSWQELARSWDMTNYVEDHGGIECLHNAYLLPIVNFGFFGLFIMLAVVGRLFREYCKIVRNHGRIPEYVLTIANGWIAIMLYSLFHSDGITNGFPASMITTSLFIGTLSTVAYINTKQ